MIEAGQDGERKLRRDASIDQTTPAAGRPRSRSRWIFRVLGLSLLTLWVYWWGRSFQENHLVSANHLWLPELDVLAGDLMVNTVPPAKAMIAGRDPYSEGLAIYPPLAYLSFVWAAPMNPKSATITWLSATAIIAGIGALAAGKARRRLALEEVPWSILLVAVLFSNPLLFAMERGNLDSLILLYVMLAIVLLKRGGAIAETVAGVVCALAMWTKFYPGLLLVGIVALRRWRAIPGFVVAGILIGLIDVPSLIKLSENMKTVIEIFSPTFNSFHVASHSLSTAWVTLLPNTKLEALTVIPGIVGAAFLLGPLLGWISLKVFCCPRRLDLAFPFLTWLLALATFVPSLANDYNLFFLPIACLASWDRRDPVVAHMLIALMILWWQPVSLPIGGDLLLAFKYGGLVAVAICLNRRVIELSQTTSQQSHQARGAASATPVRGVLGQ